MTQADDSFSSPETDEVLRWLEALKDDNYEVRGRAAKALSIISDPRIVPALIQALKDEALYVRWFALIGLGKLGDLRALPAFIECLREEDRNMNAKAVELLSRLGMPAIPPLVEVIQNRDENLYTRIIAIESLGRIGHRDAVPYLIEMLADSEWEIREKAVGALGEIGDPSITPTLIVMLSEEDIYLRCEIAEALGMIGDRRATPALVEALHATYIMATADENNIAYFRNRDACCTIIDAFGWIGDTSVIPTIRQVLQRCQKHGHIYWSAVRALQKLDPDSFSRPDNLSLLDRIYRRIYRGIYRRKRGGHTPSSQ